MHADADNFLPHLARVVLWRRAPLWFAVALPWMLLLSIPGLLVCLLWIAADMWLLRRRVAREWPRWLDAAIPDMEDSSAMLVNAESPIAQLQRRRLLGRLAAALDDAALHRVAKLRVRIDARWLALSLVAAAGVWMWQHAHASAPLPGSGAAAVLSAADAGKLTVHVAPPGYTGIAASDNAPRDLLVPEHSEVRWCLKDAPQSTQTIELSDGQTLPLTADCAVWRATESLFWRWHGARFNLRVQPDQAPEITVSQPREMIQVLPKDAKSAAIEVSVRDDYRVVSASLHLTLARGSGENIRFSDREMPLPQTSDPRTRSWSKRWSLADLGMEPGDELYFFVRASDNAPERPHISQSPTYTLRLPGPDTEDLEASALPTLVKPENLRSQRQIIIDTEQLLADMKANPKMNAESIRARSETIASDQAQLRRRYGQFLGEESSIFGEGHDHEHEHEHEHGKDDKDNLIAEFGHMHDQAENATLFDEGTKKILRRVLSSMWDAEKSLRAIEPKAALPPEYHALDAVKELQQADRIYLHRTAFVPPALKEEKRLTGDVVGALSFHRAQSGPPEAIPAELRELLQALSSDDALPALWSKTARDWIRTRIANDEQRLAAQRAVQDVADGCVNCRPVLRAWLRGAVTDAPLLLQATPQAATPFTQAWREGGKP